MKIGNLLVVCSNSDNVYIKELEKRKISFQLIDRVVSDTQLFSLGSPGIVLLINKGQIMGVKVKEILPASKVLMCSGGGKKDFEPFIIHINSDLNHDYYNYGSWSEFIGLVTKELPLQPKYLSKLNTGEYKLSRPPVDGYSFVDTEKYLHNNFQTTLVCSLAYLEWLKNWSKDVSSIRFDQSFSYLTDKKLKTLTISLPAERLLHQGKKIASEDDEVIFYLVDGKTLQANVKTVTEEGIIVTFPNRISAKKINNIRSFSLNLGEGNINYCQEFCRKIFADNGEVDYPLPLSVLRGDRSNHGPDLSAILTLSSIEQKIQRDNSEVKALAKIFGHEAITAIQGSPGTGKTFLPAVAINQLLKRGKLIVVASHSNQGLDNILAKIAGIVSEKDRDALFRLGNHLSSVSFENKVFHRAVRYKSQKEEAEGERDTAKMMASTELTDFEFLDIAKRLNFSQGVVLFVTLNSFILDPTLTMLLKDNLIDIGFIDEATKGYLFEMLPLLSAVKEKLILIGDHKQLGNIPLSQEVKDEIKLKSEASWGEIESFSEGYFATLVKLQLIPSSLLTINRRSLPKIANLVSSIFYTGQVISGRFNPFDDGQIKFLDTKSLANNGETKRNTSFYNRLEAKLVAKQFIGLAKQCLADGGNIRNCAVITPYQAQIKEIRRELRPELLFNSTLKVEPETIDSLLDELVNTVDAFQGSERYGIVLSLVRSNKANEIGFNNDIRRLNVAISRAQDKLIIIGNSETFINYYQSEIGQIFKIIIRYIKKHGRYIELKVNN